MSSTKKKLLDDFQEKRRYWTLKALDCTLSRSHFGRGCRHVEIKANRINPLHTNGRPLYLKTQSVPRSKHFSSRL